jgi:hypothetical protein
MGIDQDKLNEFMGKAIGDIGAALRADSSHCGYVFSESHGMWTTGEPFANDRGEENLNPAAVRPPLALLRGPRHSAQRYSRGVETPWGDA